jgi:hypothetical protein
MSAVLTRLLRERKLLRIRPDRKLILKEIEGATYDLGGTRQLYQVAEKTLKTRS